MNNESFLQLQSTISRFPNLRQFFDDDFIGGQCKRGIHNFYLKQLTCVSSRDIGESHLPYLENRLSKLSGILGYERLGDVLRGAYSWDRYQDALAQIDITLWYKENGLVKEIEPTLPHRKGYGDILLSFQGRDIYCEVKSFASPIESMRSRTQDEENKTEDKIRKFRQGQPWLTRSMAENKLKIRSIEENLLKKTRRQLPPNYPGILSLEAGKAGVFALDVRDMAPQLFRSRPQLALIMLWSWESPAHNDPDRLNWGRDKPSFCYVNPLSKFRVIGEALLQHLNLNSEVVGV